MNPTFRKLILAFLALCIYSLAYSQSIERQVINSVGKEYRIANAIVKISVGEPLVGKRGIPSVLSQGFFTGSPSMVSTAIIDEPVVTGRIGIAPNPTSGMLYFKRTDSETLSIQVVNV